jgi:hypothetical protein
MMAQPLKPDATPNPLPYRRKTQSDILAIQHDGTDETALAIEHWIVVHGGDATVFLKGAFIEDPHNAYVRLERTRAQNLVIPHFWVVMFEEGLFYSISNRDFHILYEPAETDYERTHG